MSRRGWVLFTVMGVIWGVPYLLIKVADGGVSVAVLVFARVFAGTLLITYLSPAVAVALGAAVLGERITPAVVISFALILIGSVLATRAPRGLRPVSPVSQVTASLDRGVPT